MSLCVVHTLHTDLSLVHVCLDPMVCWVSSQAVSLLSGHVANLHLRICSCWYGGQKWLLHVGEVITTSCPLPSASQRVYSFDNM